ncbi:SDR family NAD(P)-dependent oxidoreductase [Dactylosporangium sp. NPDC049140]|jgi:NAD(P)-dependent dehydrogenase (short-subunit alcohol dehydrogenase family)|uniref:SDR family NAD(P)-dependent oxidoreductase n=1 Tax=Dactylosporangium sp. NPDC049140 TaxID=3155647 RepID=UPI0033DCF2B5
MTIALVTGATQGLGLALAAGLARRLTPADVVYLTGRDEARIEAAAAACAEEGGARVVGRRLDVADPSAAEEVAAEIGGIDIVFGNAVMRVGPDDDPRAIVGTYTQVNNFGTTRLLRAFAPRLRDGGRLLIVASSLGTLHHLAPSLHRRFDGLTTLDEVDEATAAWRDEVADGRARAMAWPGFVNIPSKIAQVSAVRALASERRQADAARDILVAAVCPGMINTPTSGLWWDVSAAPAPAEAAVALLDLALGQVQPGHYGELVRFGRPLPWKP